VNALSSGTIMANLFRDATDDDRRLTAELVERIISIYWDGEGKFFEGRILSYDKESNCFHVIYYNDDSGEVYLETLSDPKQLWRVWTGSNDEFEEYLKRTVSA
jgi:hypothetical protein